jgi:phosphate transport system substrate-binding protein
MRFAESGSVSRRGFIVSSGAAGAALVAGCTEQASNTETEGTATGGDSLSGEISISGSSTVFPLAEAVAEDFMEEHPDVRVSVNSTGSGGGFSNFFCVGDAEFNNASRQIKASEKDLCAENDVDFHEITVAQDALTVIVNNDNDWVDCVTPDDLAAIWGPDAADTWSDVNDDWPDETIERFGPATTSGTFDYFSEEINGEAGAHTSDYQPTEKDNVIVTGVTGSKYAIGYFGFSFYYNNPEKTKALGIDDGEGCVDPSLDNAKSGEYPLSRPLFTYPRKDALAEEHVAEFARFFVEQSANQELVADTVGYVPNSDSEMQSQLDKLNAVIDEVQ